MFLNGSAIISKAKAVFRSQLVARSSQLAFKT